MDMSITALAVNAASIDTQSTIGLAMVKKSLEAMSIEGAGMRELLESSVTPYLGQNIDYSV